MKQYKVAILGCGSRGVDVYGAKMLSMPDQFKIVSVCDKNKKRCEYLKQYLHLPDDAVFYDEEEFFREILCFFTQNLYNNRYNSAWHIGSILVCRP